MFARLISDGGSGIDGIGTKCIDVGWTPSAPGVCSRGANPAGFCTVGEVGMCYSGSIPGVCSLGDYPW